MSKFVREMGRNFNLIYDKKSIKSAVSYLAEHNPIPGVTYDDIFQHMLRDAKKNAFFADNDHSEDGAWVMNYTGTAGYMIIYSFIQYTEKNDFPVIQADVYVTPSFVQNQRDNYIKQLFIFFEGANIR